MPPIPTLLRMVKGVAISLLSIVLGISTQVSQPLHAPIMLFKAWRLRLLVNRELSPSRHIYNLKTNTVMYILFLYRKYKKENKRKNTHPLRPTRPQRPNPAGSKRV